jgi:secondary thiamine-phosphate synthase enzyme
VKTRLSAIRSLAPDLVTGAELTVDTQGEGFTEITKEVAQFVAESHAGEGAVLLYLRHTSASLVIQENADSDVQTDLVTALHMAAPADGPWVHKVEGADDMPAHIKTMLTGVTLHVPVHGGTMALGTWQGIYLLEHRTQPHRREVILQFIGSKA